MLREGCGGDGRREGLEVGFAGDEIGLAVHLDHGGRETIGRLVEDDHALGSDAGGLLVSLGKALLAHELGGGLEVALGFDQGPLAFHHARAGALAELLD